MYEEERTLKDNLPNFQLPLVPMSSNELHISPSHSQGWLSGIKDCPCIPTKVDGAVVSRSKAKISEALERNLQGPRDHMESYGESGSERERERERERESNGS